VTELASLDRRDAPAPLDLSAAKAFRMGDDHGAERRARRAEVSSCAASAHQTVLAETADPAAAREAARKAAATAQRRAA
jgi:hypothetical protein